MDGFGMRRGVEARGGEDGGVVRGVGEGGVYVGGDGV